MASLAPLRHEWNGPRGLESDDIADLSAIFDPGINLCVARRQVPAGVTQFVSELLAKGQNFEKEMLFEGERATAERLLPDDLAAAPEAAAWLADVAFLARLFRDLFGVESLGLRLRVLDHAMCPRFHVDRVQVRLVCTYGGPGSEWLPESAVDRAKLGHGACGLPDERSGLITDRRAIRTMPALAIGLMKGEVWDGNEGRGAVHRSPQLTAAQPRRLLLTVDPL